MSSTRVQNGSRVLLRGREDPPVRAATALVLALVAAVGQLPTGAAPAAAEGSRTRYVSFTVGRGLASEGVGCFPTATPAPGAVGTLRVAAYAAARGIPMSANLVPAYLEAGRERGGRYCKGGGTHIYLSLRDARRLQEDYGWRHSTSGLEYRRMTSLTPSKQVAEACGALDYLHAHGFSGARGMYAAAAPGGRNLTDRIVRGVIQGRCHYVWVRDYGEHTWNLHPKRADGSRIPTNVRGNLSPVGYHRTVSLNGGSCPSRWRCGQGGARDYMDPAEIIDDIRDAPPDSHTVVQWYRVVEGDQPGRWSCTGPARRHRTYTAETYCWADLRAILDALPRDVVATDPLTVARAWGVG